MVICSTIHASIYIGFVVIVDALNKMFDGIAFSGLKLYHTLERLTSAIVASVALVLSR